MIHGPQGDVLAALTRARDARSARSSSWDPSGRNQDYWVIAPGESIVLADLEGPGCITHIWMTQFCRRVLGPGLLNPIQVGQTVPVLEIHSALGLSWEAPDPDYYRKVLHKIYWDDHEHPSVLAPLGDFFCIGHSMPGNFASIPFTVSSKQEECYTFGGTAALNCYLQMPFGRRARAMYARAEAAGVKHMTYFTWRWLPIARYVRQLIDAGYIGRCFQCSIRYAIGFAREQRYLWRLDPAHANGILGDLGSHAIDLAQWYVGPIAWVSAHLVTLMEHPGPDGRAMDAANDSAALSVAFENGATGLIQLSALVHIGERNQDVRIALHGDAGTLEIDLRFNGGEIRGVRDGGKWFETLPVPADIAGDVDPRGPLQVFVRQAVGDRLFIDAILQDRPVEPSFYDGMRAQVVIDAALQAHETGCWINVG